MQNQRLFITGSIGDSTIRDGKQEHIAENFRGTYEWVTRDFEQAPPYLCSGWIDSAISAQYYDISGGTYEEYNVCEVILLVPFDNVAPVFM